MSRSLLGRLVVSLILVIASQCAAQQPAPAGKAKTIKNQLEYDQYMHALNIPTPFDRGMGLEAFVILYPQSIVRMEALENAVAAYKQAGRLGEVENVCKKILAIEPGNVPAFASIAFIERGKGTSDSASEGEVFAREGLRALPSWTKPAGMKDEEFSKLRAQTTAIFYGAIAFAALQRNDYARARDEYSKALAIDSSNLQDMFQAGISEVEMSPIDLNGFWHLARALNMARAQNNSQAAKAIGDYSAGKYRKYHGNGDGWDEFIAKTATLSAPPQLAELQKSITPQTPPCDLAVQAVQQYGAASLSFADWEFVLENRDCSLANKAAADLVWKEIQSKQQGGTLLRLEGVKVVVSTQVGLDAALTEDNQAADRGDLRVLFESPDQHPPAKGSIVDVIGAITEYKVHPFLFIMEHAEIAGR